MRLLMMTAALAMAALTANSASGEDAGRFELPQYVGPPVAQNAIAKRAFMGVPSMAVAPEGRLWATWYAGITPGEDVNNYVVLSTSGDNGKTWRELLVVDPDGGGPRRTFDPQLWIAPDGKLRWTWTEMTGRIFDTQRLWMMEFSDPESAESPRTEPVSITNGVMMNKPLVLSTGEWVLPVSTWFVEQSSKMVVSEDHGKSWFVRGSATIPEEHRNCDEPTFIERKDGSLWLLSRTKYGIGESISTDRGKTWPELKPFKLKHATARFFIRRLASGNLLLVKHGLLHERIGRSHLTAYLSKDEGASWLGGLMLDERLGVSYPDGQQDKSGLIRIIYDWDRGAKGLILMASFREEDVLAGRNVSNSVHLRQVVSKGPKAKSEPSPKPAPSSPTTEKEKQSLWRNSASGLVDSVPAGYVPPLVSNGSLGMLIDFLGGQTQRDYVRMRPSIWWAGRRYGPPVDHLIPFGHFKHEMIVDGNQCGAPKAWTQTLDTKKGVVTCRNEYDGGLVVETEVFTPLNHDLVVLKRRLTTSSPKPRNVRMIFHYQFTPPGNENRRPRRVSCNGAWNKDSGSAEFRYHADGLRPYDGIISVFSDKSAKAIVDGQTVVLSSEMTLDASHPAQVSTCLLFADTMDGKDYLDRAEKLLARVRQEGYDGLLAEHQKAWAAYWGQSYVQLPDKKLQRMYHTAQYHLRANATRWSFPVGIFDTHWSGRYFGWDEMFCYLALASSNHLDISRRCPEFRLSTLPNAVSRNSHYGKPGIYGARYPWETLENGAEGAPPGFWMDHVFHMSNIALSSWFQYLYTDDLEYLETTGYPVVRECARFFLTNMVYESPDGGMFIGKCTDLERLGPARRNPFMTSCGAIHTLEAAARAASLLKKDESEAATWKDAAAKLRESLPHDNDQYVPYAGCEEKSIASVGGLFPYPLFDASNTLQKNAAYGFREKGKRSGNMYPVGKSMCAWYAGWLAAALAALEDKTEPVRLLSEAAEGTGCFAELFEINEPKVSTRPWFSTASGNVVYAMNQILVQSRDDRILIAPAVPDGWKDYSFKLACHGNLSIEVAVRSGRLVKLTLLPGDTGVEMRRMLVLPAALANGLSSNKSIVRSMSEQNGKQILAVCFQGRAEVVEVKR